MFAAGHSPLDVADWTWSQLTEVATCVQAYHLDLAARIATGKSPALEEAKKPPKVLEEHRSVWQDPPPAPPTPQGGQEGGPEHADSVAAEGSRRARGTRDDPTAAQAEAARTEAMGVFKSLEESQRARGSMASFKVSSTRSPDLFAEFRRRKRASQQARDGDEG